jgi:phenylpyruvate tautomerase PptA (4-oxalocrotonate tautomerase family)
MPVLFIEAPPGISPESKRKMVQKLTEAIDEAYHIGDTLIFLREYPAEDVAMDGTLQSENPRILEALNRIRAGA